MLSQEVYFQLGGNVNIKCWGTEKDRLISVVEERVIDGKVFNIVLTGWYGILIGKARRETKIKILKIQKEILYPLYQTLLKDET